MVKHMTDNGLYSECQHGFRKQRSCITQLLLVMEGLTKFIEDGHPIDIVYLDFKKAFDSVPHQRLLLVLSKLAAYGITGNMFNSIKDFLTNRHQTPDGEGSTPLLTNDQGFKWHPPGKRSIGPILFTIFINDLPDCCKAVVKSLLMIQKFMI